jgi:diguanylate cyclase (GGDEF)-like protein
MSLCQRAIDVVISPEFSSMKLLLVEDDPVTRELLVFHLSAAHYAVDQAADGLTGLELASTWDYDLLLLDLQLPELDGLSLCQRLRAQGKTIPILMLTAQSEGSDIVTGLDAGADDYVTKPFDMDQILARIRALLRRQSNTTLAPQFTWGDLCLDPAIAQVTYRRQPVALTPKEYSLLELFLRHPQRVFSRSAILDHLWTMDDFPSEGAVTNLVKDLRNRLKRSGVEENLIQTVYGLGYRLNKCPEPADPPVASTLGANADPDLAPTKLSAAGQQHYAKISARFLESVHQRLAVLEEAIRALQAGGLTPQQQVIARDEAHRLSGGLGTFGYQEGSQQAKAIEASLKAPLPLDHLAIEQLSKSLLALKQSLEAPSVTQSSPDAPDRPDQPANPRGHRLLTVALPEVLLSQIRPMGMSLGWHIESIAAHSLDGQLSSKPADSLLLALDASQPLTERLVPLQVVKHIWPDTPVVVLADQDSLEERVQVARLKGERYLAAPVTAAQVFDTLNQVLPQSSPPEARILVVDEDPLICASVAHLLSPWGMQVTAVKVANQFWEALRQTHPHLLILSLEMPTFSGCELCQVVRQDPQYGDLPILMLTSSPSTITVRQVFEVGGDDLISKPIVGPELVTRVLSRIERSRLRQQLEQMRQQQTVYWPQLKSPDPITQIATQQHFEAFLHQQWERHRQDNAPLAIILCSPDGFQDYLESYGQQAGEHLQRRLAHMLQHSINPNIDLVAHYKQHEFAILLPDTSLEGALRVTQRLQQAVLTIEVPPSTANEPAQVTLSFGISGAVPTLSLDCQQLVVTATQALKISKTRGGNTFCLYPV